MIYLVLDIEYQLWDIEVWILGIRYYASDNSCTLKLFGRLNQGIKNFLSITDEVKKWKIICAKQYFVQT